jgi:hypothetical protein
MPELKLPCTKKALEAYDAAYAAYHAHSEQGMRQPATLVLGSQANRGYVERSQALSDAEDEAQIKVKEAFAEETKDRNSKDNAMLVGARDPWLRKLVAKYG